MLCDDEKFSLPKIEEKVLKFWKENQVFERSLAKKSKKNFVFFEGPPTANGRPGIHHVLARSFKDVVLRYKTMRGFNVPRKGGWDTHGLPVEIEVEKTLGLRSKKEIEAYGIAAFNKKCKESVWKYKDEWERLTERIGFWLDLKNPYITYETSYIETLWWIISQIWKKKLLYKGHKVLPWCTRCGTALSSHELALGYKEVEDTSVYVKFKLKSGQKIGKFVTDDHTYILSWTTTPWTLPGNVALAVGGGIDYIMVKVYEFEPKKENIGGVEPVKVNMRGPYFYVLAKNKLDMVLKNPGRQCEILEEFTGRDLIGLEYQPLFDVSALKSKNSYKIYAADFVNTNDGTGAVHTAVMYGEDDYALGKKMGLPQHHTVAENGTFTKDVSGLAGMYVKAKNTEEKIVEHLKTNHLLLKEEKYKHEYPHCWRCGTALLYYARDSWFVAMTKLKPKLLAANKKINWIPENIKNGRFGGWLKEVKDWAFSRERYWGTPLPIWECDKCDWVESISSRQELSDRVGKGRNRYILMRHGYSENNHLNIINNGPRDLDKYPLTIKGRAQAEEASRHLLKKGIDLIISSDFRRVRETAEIVREKLKIKEKVILDPRIREINTGIYDGRPGKDYKNFFSSIMERFTKTPEKGESLRDVCRRASDFLGELEDRYEGKTILVVTHEYGVWALETVMRGWSEEESVLEKEKRGEDFVGNTEWEEVLFLDLPRNEYGIADLHRPYVDDVVFSCSKCKKGRMMRIKEVVDVWFDSGAMPFAEAHWPFSQTSNQFLYPADYIVEGLDQTRGWFYTLLAVATLLGKGAPYKNVITNGIILDKYGKKMSKSKGNVVDPWAMIEKYGADVVRWYFYTTHFPGESKGFDEADLLKVSRQFFAILYNSFVFYDTYADKKSQVKSHKLKVKNILDKWILARMDEVAGMVTKKLDQYEIGGAARIIEGFVVEDLSRWYIRRSRERLQRPDSTVFGKKDFKEASEVFKSVLLGVSELIAPFAPFFGESLYKSLVTEKGVSIHLVDWPNSKKLNVGSKRLIEDMNEIRRISSLALAKRAELGVKVRQPLASLKLKTKNKKLNKELLSILKDEVNVKNVFFGSKQKEEIIFDTKITTELMGEGVIREFTRTVQGLRSDAKLQPKDTIVLMIECAGDLRNILEKNESVLKKKVNAKTIDYKRSDKFDVELQTKFEDVPLWIALRKVTK